MSLLSAPSDEHESRLSLSPLSNQRSAMHPDSEGRSEQGDGRGAGPGIR